MLRFAGHDDYECYVGLYLNRQRVETRRAGGTLKALFASHDAALDKEWFEAFAESEEEALAQFNRAQAMNGNRLDGVFGEG